MIRRRGVREIEMRRRVGRMGSISDDGPGQHNPDRNEDPWGKVALAACTGVHRRTAAPRLRTRTGCRQRRARRADANRKTRRTRSRTGRPRLIYRPSSRTGENPPYGSVSRKKLVCSVGDRPTKVIVRGLVAWIAERREIECLMPIDKAIFRMVSKSSGRNESERRFGLEKRKPQRKPSSLP